MKSANRKIILYIQLLGFGLFVLIGIHPQANAQGSCSPGLPCIVPYTPNDPFNQPISPNVPGAPNAPKNTSNVCDADFMNQIYGNVFLESQRETISAEAIMLKPDSVMEYTCFDQQASLVAVIAPLSFSFPTGALPGLIRGMVLEGLLTYIDENFWHVFLGGAAAGLDTTITNVVTLGGYDCPLMKEVHMVAKCSDFGLEAPFMRFEELISFEPRQLPRACTTGTKITPELIALSKNEGGFFVYLEEINTYLSKMRPAVTNQSITQARCENQKPIPTGVLIFNVEMGTDILGRPVEIAGSKYTYEDKVCSNPACSFDHKNNADSRDDICVPLR